MKVGNTIGGLTVTDVKRVNKLNLIQFLKEVDNYLQKGYRIDVNSARQVGLVLQTDVYKTEAACSPKVGSTEVGSTGVKVESKADEVKVEAVQAEDTETKVEDSKETESTSVEAETGTDVPVKKPTTTRSKKVTQ